MNKTPSAAAMTALKDRWCDCGRPATRRIGGDVECDRCRALEVARLNEHRAYRATYRDKARVSVYAPMYWPSVGAVGVMQ